MFKNIVWVIGFYLLALVSTSISSEDQLNGYLAEKWFATKTSYEKSRLLFEDFLRNTSQIGQQTAQIPAEDFYPAGKCVPKQLSILLRHGTRYPSKGDIQGVAKFIEKFQGLDLSDDFSHLKDWHNDFTFDNEKRLSESGAEENVLIAKRFVKAFPNLFAKSLSAGGTMEYMASDTQRTVASADGFATGIAAELGESVSKDDVISRLELRNDLLRFFDRCSSYKYKVEDNDHSMVEFAQFRDGVEMRKAAQAVSRRVNRRGDADLLDTDDLRYIWVICGFETALRGIDGESDWCKMLTTDETHVLEYTWDLKLFWRKSYGYLLNYEQACPLITDFMVNFHHAAIDDRAPAVSVYFGHAETLLPVQALLGLFQDDDVLLASNYDKHHIRKFRTSLTASFASNLALVLYECEEGPQTSHPNWPKDLGTHMVQVLANEHVLPLPFTDKWAVNVEDFETQYYQYVHHCEFDKLCENKPVEVKLERDEL